MAPREARLTRHTQWTLPTIKRKTIINLMNVTGYTIWKPMIICGGAIDLKESDSAFIIFLKAFPDLEKEFFLGNEFWIKTDSAHLSFLENSIKERLEVANKNASWKNDFDEEKIAFLRKGGRILQFEFQGVDYEINTFGNKDNSITMDLISLYDMLLNCKDGLGLKITPEK